MTCARFRSLHHIAATVFANLTNDPVGLRGPDDIAFDHTGGFWFTDWGTTAIGRMTLGGAFVEFGVAPHGATSDGLDGITAGPDGNLWFTEYQAGRIGKMTLSGVVTEYVLPGGHGASGGITTGPDGNLWFTEGNALSGYQSDACLIKIADKIAETKSAIVLDQGGILLVKISGLPDVKCE